jgi:hypothetical protein
MVLGAGCGGGGEDRLLPVDSQPQAMVWDDTNWDEGEWQ